MPTSVFTVNCITPINKSCTVSSFKAKTNYKKPKQNPNQTNSHPYLKKPPKLKKKKKKKNLSRLKTDALNNGDMKKILTKVNVVPKTTFLFQLSALKARYIQMSVNAKGKN